MTKRVTVSLPDDIADGLEAEPNASAYVAEAIRQRVAREHGRRLIEEQGFAITDEGLARARERLAEADRQWPAERRQALRERFGVNDRAA